MKDAPLFTVVIAGYRTEPWLPRALASVRNQTFADFEAICYVEESPDKSLEICRAAAAEDSRFRVATGPVSGGVSSTRNYGIEHGRGKYLAVLDGDDWLADDMLEKLAEKLAATGPVDILSFAAVTTGSDTVDMERAERLTNFRAEDAAEVFSGLEAIRRTGRNGGKICNYTWLSVYRREFLLDRMIRQTPGRLMEDFESTPRMWYCAERFAYLDEVLYVYRRRPGSLTTEASARIITDLAMQFRSLLNFVSGHEVPADVLRIWSNQWVALFYWFLFHPVTSAKLRDGDRRRALEILFEGEGRPRFMALARFASRSRRAALPLLKLAARGWQLPAKIFFRQLYYPMTAGRGKRRK